MRGRAMMRAIKGLVFALALSVGCAGALGVGLLSGGYGREELERAGAYRVYDDPLDLHDHLDEVGIRRAL